METETKDAEDVIYDIQQYLIAAKEEFIAEIANKVCPDNYSWDYAQKKFIVYKNT